MIEQLSKNILHNFQSSPRSGDLAKVILANPTYLANRRQDWKTKSITVIRKDRSFHPNKRQSRKVLWPIYFAASNFADDVRCKSNKKFILTRSELIALLPRSLKPARTINRGMHWTVVLIHHTLIRYCTFGIKIDHYFVIYDTLITLQRICTYILGIVQYIVGRSQSRNCIFLQSERNIFLCY